MAICLLLQTATLSFFPICINLHGASTMSKQSLTFHFTELKIGSIL